MKLPTIVVVAIDTLRPDHLGCYGYERPTSPHIDALAAESVVFDQAIAAGIPTMPAFTTMSSGLHPYRHGIVSHAGKRRLAEDIVLLPQLAQARGYVTAACDNLVVQGEGRGSWFARGYDHYSGFLYKPFSDQSRQITDRAIAFLDNYAQQPLFLFVHYWDPHTPYGPLPPFDTLHYRPGSGPYELSEVEALAPEYYKAFLDDMKLRHRDDYAYVVAQYDGEISQVDQQVGRLVETIKERGAWDDTIFVLLSDHGECFGEGGFFFDHHGLYDAVTRITLMMHLPDCRPRRIGALVSSEDLLPSLITLGDLEEPPYELSGYDLTPLIYGDCEAVRERVISVESSRQASLALRTPNWKLILPIVRDAQGQPLPDFYGRERDPAPLLFDLRNDPHERINRAAHEPERLKTMLGELAEWRAEMAALTGEPDPILNQGLSLHYDIFMRRLLARR